MISKDDLDALLDDFVGDVTGGYISNPVDTSQIVAAFEAQQNRIAELEADAKFTANKLQAIRAIVDAWQNDAITSERAIDVVRFALSIAKPTVEDLEWGRKMGMALGVITDSVKTKIGEE